MGTRRTVCSRYPAGQRASKSFSRVFDGVSSVVQRQIVEQALVPFLDTIPRKYAKRAIVKARRVVRKSDKVPRLDLGAKKVEVNCLLDELARDAKSPISGGSNVATLLREIIESISDWLNDLWSLTFEFGLDFTRAHSCLLFSTGVLDHLQGIKGTGCQCIFSTIYVPVTIKRRSGEVVKEFSDLGLSNVTSAILWTWREVFISLLASNSQSLVDLMPKLLEEIDDITDWRSLERLLLGGATQYACAQAGLKRCIQRYERMKRLQDDEAAWKNDMDQDDIFYADHWHHKLTRCVPRFRRLVQYRMITIFKAAPRMDLYCSIHSLATDYSVKGELHAILSQYATTSASFLSTVIEVYASDQRYSEIVELLDTHAFLLRPRDCDTLEKAVWALASSDEDWHGDKALEVAEKEVLDTTHTIKQAVHRVFGLIDKPEQREALDRILALRRTTAGRQERVETWVDAALPPGQGEANPAILAALMIGLPVPVHEATAEDMEYLRFEESDPSDSDYIDMREEIRPDLKGRLNTWLDVLREIPGGEDVLEKTFEHMRTSMPWIVASDIVETMIGRLADKPSKHHICDALYALSEFVKEQKKLRHLKRKRMRTTLAATLENRHLDAEEATEGADAQENGLESQDEHSEKDNEFSEFDDEVHSGESVHGFEESDDDDEFHDASDIHDDDDDAEFHEPFDLCFLSLPLPVIEDVD